MIRAIFAAEQSNNARENAKDNEKCMAYISFISGFLHYFGEHRIAELSEWIQRSSLLRSPAMTKRSSTLEIFTRSFITSFSAFDCRSLS
jgi:hypothetical protein